MKRSESDGELSGEEDAFSLENPSLRGRGKSGKQHHYNGSDDYLVLGDGDELSSSGEHSARTVSAEIYSLNKVLKEALPLTASSVDSEEKEGYLFIQTKLVSQWKRRWCVWKRCNGEGLLLGGYALYYYKDKNQAASYKKPLLKFSKPKDDPRAMGRINMTFAHKEAFTTREKETIALAMEKQAIPQSKQFVRLASPNRIFSVAAESDENLDEWFDVWHAYLKEALENDQYAFKIDAANRLEPLIRLQYSVWLEKAATMVKALEANGFFDDKFSHQKRDKAGSLELESQKSPGTWKRFRFILKGRHLYYYPHNKGHTAKRVIVLQYSSTEEDGETQADGSYVFQLTTPLITYTIKAPHKVAAEEWITAIEKAKQGKRKSGKKGDPLSGEGDTKLSLLSSQAEDVPEGAGINPRFEGAFLTYMLPDARKEKVYKIKKDSVKIGRSSTNDLMIDDSRLSREHARIDTSNDRLVFVDLGSKRGSKVNHHMCNGRRVLRDGDLIKVGRTRMRVFAGKPDKH